MSPVLHSNYGVLANLISTRSCSISCYKEHKQAHESATAQPSSRPTEAPKPAPAKPSPEPSSLQSSTQALRTSPLYKTLLTRHPNLRSELLKIYTATLRPPEKSASDEERSPERDGKRRRTGGGRERSRGRGGGGRSRGGGPGGKHPWDPERGRKKALRLLRQMVEREEGVREFGEVVKIVGNEKNG